MSEQTTATGHVVWRCQGCDIEMPLREIDALRRLHITLSHSNHPPIIAEVFELCPACQNRMISFADPRKWPRGPSHQ